MASDDHEETSGHRVAHAGLAKDHSAKRQRHEQERPVQQEPSSGSGVKRCSADDEAIRRAVAEAEKALTRARVLEDRKAAKRASATSVQRAGRINGDGGHPAAAAAWMTAAEAVLADTRVTSGGSHSFSTPTDTRHDSSCRNNG